MSLRIWLFKRSRLLASRLPRIFTPLHSFLWLHVLTYRDLNAITVQDYSSKEGRGCFGSLEHNFGGLWDWEKAAVEELLSECKSVLVAAAGGGREMIALARMGVKVEGFDASPNLAADCIENLRRAGVIAQMSHAPASCVATMAETYDALFIGRGAYHHIPGRKNRVQFLRDCRKWVKAGAPIYVGDVLMRSEKGHRLTRLKLLSRIERGDMIGSSYFHFFSPSELESELRAAGFADVAVRATPFPGGDGKLAHVFARAGASQA